MDTLGYKSWKQKRLSRIINLLGEDWFSGKSILELAAGYGDIGIELMELGADVTFADANEEFLNIIQSKIPYPVPLVKFDQNNYYDLGKKFDLVLHLGVLYHILNWKEDLKCAFNHSDKIILETIVEASQNKIWEKKIKVSPQLWGNTLEEKSLFSEKAVDNEIKKSGYSYLKLNNSSLNTNFGWGIGEKNLERHIYDWTPENVRLHSNYIKDGVSYNTHFRKMWFILK